MVPVVQVDLAEDFAVLVCDGHIQFADDGKLFLPLPVPDLLVA